jgi:diguanylate cyclase (GGDEF)-like protein
LARVERAGAIAILNDMTIPLRVLLVEDSEDDAALLLRELRKGGYQTEHRRVDCGADLEEALRHETWDLIVTDHNLPGYSSEAALAAVRRNGSDAPVIIVSGSIGEDIAVEAMKNGANDYIMKGNMTRLVPAVDRELRESKMRHAHRRAQETIQHLAFHDTLTGLANRHEFDIRAHQALRTAGDGVRHALLYMDLDQFKIINDTCGHVAGDELLRQLAVVLREPIRDTDTLARLGGDEFGVLLTHCSIEHALQIADRLLHIVRDFRYVWQDKTFSIGASIGLVMLEDRSQTMLDILRMADMACYAAKDKGRNRVHVYRPGDTELLQRHGEMQWIARLTEALEHDRFEIFAQHIVPLNGHGNRHCEFLVRMLDSHDQRILPGAFIPAAERYSLMPTLDRWIVRHAFEHLAKHQRATPGGGDAYFINLSGSTVSDEQFATYVIDQLAAHGLSGDRIGFEITETAVIADLSSAMSFIERVKRVGCRIALDDFGAGLSSFSYLKTIPADYLKIDGGFIKDMLDDPMDHAIVEAVNRIGHVAGLQTIAEFVETDKIRARLCEIGVDYAQGFAIGRPAPLPVAATLGS